MENFNQETMYNNFDRWLYEPRLQKGEGAGHYFNDFTPVHTEYADGWYIRKAKNHANDVREMLIEFKLRGNRLAGQANTENTLHRGLETGYNLPEHGKLPHLDYKHKKGRFEHLYRKHK